MVDDRIMVDLMESIDVGKAFRTKYAKQMRPQTYIEIQNLSSNPANTAFQDLFGAYYFANNPSWNWKEKYFKVFEEAAFRKETEIRPILETLLDIRDSEGNGRVELSYASKMLATINPFTHPLWDSKVDAALTSKDEQGRCLVSFQSIAGNEEERLELAVEKYELLCKFYSVFAKSNRAQECSEAFEARYPECHKEVGLYKRLDFILWSLREQIWEAIEK